VFLQKGGDVRLIGLRAEQFVSDTEEGFSFFFFFEGGGGEDIIKLKLFVSLVF
jgi:hypothetical protein